MITPRKRDLLLSLKSGTTEASFSVPMLNLTLAQYPFVVAFAVTALGWRADTVGWLCAIPHLCNAIQPPINLFLNRHFSLHRIMVLGFLVHALPWLGVALLPWLGPWRDVTFLLIVLLSTLANSVTAVAWAASMSEVVPLHIHERYFSRRNAVSGFWALLAVMAAGQVAQSYRNALWIFGIIFAAAALMRLAGLFFLARMKFPATVMQRRERQERLTEYLAVFRDRRFLWVLLFVGTWGFALNLGMPFYSVYIIRDLPLNLADLTVLATLATLGGLLSFGVWGRLSERFGNKPVLMVCALSWALISLPAWLLAGPTRYHHLYPLYFIVGVMTGGFQLCQFNLMIRLLPVEGRSAYISVFLAFTSVLTALGPLLGGLILMRMPDVLGSVLGQPLMRFHVVFAGSLLLCLLTVLFLRQLEEPASRPLRELVQVMRSMREFNPVLGLAALALAIFTPKEIGRFASKTLWTLRRQSSDVAEVSELLVSHGWRRVRRSIRHTPRP